jgi:PAP2 superfamily
MKRRVTGLGSAAILVAPLLVAAVLAQPASAAGSAAGATAVRTWNEITVSTLVVAKTPTPEQPLYLTYVHRAVYDAVRQTTRHHASSAAAAVAAAHDVLVADFPAQKDVLDADYVTSLAAIPAGPRRSAGLAICSAAAAAVLLDRANDGRNGAPLPVPPPGPGVWIPTPPNTIGVSSWLGSVRPFVLRSASQFRPAGPPALSSARWARDYNETRLYGSATSTLRTPSQTETAKFWSDAPYVQNQRALRAYALNRGLDALQTARLFALTDTAAADALIACWDTKTHFNFWRPFSAIPAGDTDGNAATPADPTWQPLLVTPNHPEYASAHGCATTAMFTVVARLSSPHGDRLNVDLDSVTTGTTHHFSSVHQLISEVANARVWGGLHWRFSTLAGERIGASVARVVLRRNGCG